MKKDELRALTSKLRVTDAELLQRGTALTHAQEQLRELSEQQSEQLMRADELHVGHQHIACVLRVDTLHVGHQHLACALRVGIV